MLRVSDLKSILLTSLTRFLNGIIRNEKINCLPKTHHLTRKMLWQMTTPKAAKALSIQCFISKRKMKTVKSTWKLMRCFYFFYFLQHQPDNFLKHVFRDVIETVFKVYIGLSYSNTITVWILINLGVSSAPFSIWQCTKVVHWALVFERKISYGK